MGYVVLYWNTSHPNNTLKNFTVQDTAGIQGLALSRQTGRVILWRRRRGGDGRAEGRQHRRYQPQPCCAPTCFWTFWAWVKTLRLHSTAQHTEAHKLVGDTHADSVHQTRELTTVSSGSQLKGLTVICQANEDSLLLNYSYQQILR